MSDSETESTPEEVDETESKVEGPLVRFPKLTKGGRTWTITVRLLGSKGPADIWDSGLMEGEEVLGYEAEYFAASGKIGGKIHEYKPRKVTVDDLSRGRNVLKQAIDKATSKYTKMLRRKGFHREAETVVAVFEPMLLNIYEPKLLKPGSFVQPKFDGVRACTTYNKGAVQMSSRQAVDFGNIPLIDADLKRLYEETAKLVDVMGLHFDGEIYAHGVRAVKVAGAMNAKVLTAAEQKIIDECVYVLFDCRADAEPDLTFASRIAFLKKIYELSKWEQLYLAPTTRVNNDAEVQTYFSKYIKLGFEGAVVKADVPYRSGSRTNAALKVKETHEGEFVIVGYSTGKGSHEGLLKFRLKTPNDVEFDQMFIGTADESRTLYKQFQTNFSKFKGMKVTLLHRKLNENGIPTHVMETKLRTDLV